MPSGSLSLAYSIADQNFHRTKSLGILNLSLQLGAALSVRPEISTFDLFSNSSLHEWHSRFAGRAVHCFDRATATRLGRVLWDQYGVYREARNRGVEWLLLPKGFASFCRTPPIRVGTYVHDVIGEWYRERYPGAVSRSEAWYFRQSLLATLKHSTVIFTNSDFTRTELQAFAAKHAIRAPSIVIAGIGCTPVTEAAGGERNLIVVLASPWRHKRTDLAVQYMLTWQRSTRFRGRVHWVGRFPPDVKPAPHPHWEYHERMDERAYRLLLAASRVVVYFSEYRRLRHAATRSGLPRRRSRLLVDSSDP